MNTIDRDLVIDATIHDWQMAGDNRSYEKIWPEAECYIEAYAEKFDELVAEWVDEGMDLDDAREEAGPYALEAAMDAVKEFEADNAA